MRGLLQRVGKWLRDNQERQYLQGLSNVELMDCGYSRADMMTALAAPKDTRQRMQSMATAYGLPPDALNKEHWRAMDIARACGQCRERAMCRRWLNGQQTDVSADEFCPNAEHFAEMAMSHGVTTTAYARRQKSRDSF